MDREAWGRVPGRIACLLVAIFLVAACSEKQQELPYFGPKTVNELEDGGTDTSFFQLPDFSLVDQDSNVISQSDLTGKIYVADFFFTSCPTICPKMKQQMLRVYDEFAENEKVVLLSHTIDPRHDTVKRLKKYGEKLGIESSKWHLLTGEKDAIYELAGAYMVSAATDPTAPGGYIHSGAFLLVDEQKHIRGIYDGTDPVQVDNMMRDMHTLLGKK